uniref:Septin-type G domain-containing protein n=1 Tax=Panagrellus redivivus TaxID=6233 RepID=A0A7E4ZVK5_PANRE
MVPMLSAAKSTQSVNRLGDAMSTSTMSSVKPSRLESIFGTLRRRGSILKRGNSNASTTGLKFDKQRPIISAPGGTVIVNGGGSSTLLNHNAEVENEQITPPATCDPLFRPIPGTDLGSATDPTSAKTVTLLNFATTSGRRPSNAEGLDDCDSRGLPHPNKRVQTTFTVNRAPFTDSETSESDDFDHCSDELAMMDIKKSPFGTPTNPPPPVPHHTKSRFNGANGTDGSPSAGVASARFGAGANGGPILKKPTFPAAGAPAKPALSKKPSNGDEPRDVPTIKLNGFVGFDSLPYQLVHKCQAKGFQFNLLCVGETGMGKTTLIESLFNMKLEFDPCNNALNTVELRTKVCEVKEGGVAVKVRIVETAGFGDQLDKDKSAKVIVDYLNAQFEGYLKEELKVCRQISRFDDTRIHACLYFISPTGHGLKALDIVTIRELSKRANVIPVIAKADTTSKDELARFKQRCLAELRSQNIDFYQFPTDDDAIKVENAALNELMPFAVVGATDFVTKEDGSRVRARRYPWGIVEVENEEHCDFVKLRKALLRINVDSLITRTHSTLYEAYRRERLREMKMKDGDCGPKMAEAYEEKEREFRDEMRQKDEEFQRDFTRRVNAKEEELHRLEELLNMREREQRERFEAELMRLESMTNSILDERAKLEGRTTKKKQKA